MLCYLSEGSGQLFRPSGQAITSLPEVSQPQTEVEWASSNAKEFVEARWRITWLEGIRTSNWHNYAKHSYGAWHGRWENCQRRLVLHSAAKYPTFERQECTLLDICLGLDQFNWAIVHGGADAWIATRFIKLAAPHQWQVSSHFSLTFIAVLYCLNQLSSANHSELLVWPFAVTFLTLICSLVHTLHALCTVTLIKFWGYMGINVFWR